MKTTKPDTVAIRQEGQKLLQGLRARGFELPSLEKLRMQSHSPQRIHEEAVSGFAEENAEPLKLK